MVWADYSKAGGARKAGNFLLNAVIDKAAKLGFQHDADLVADRGAYAQCDITMRYRRQVKAAVR